MSTRDLRSAALCALAISVSGTTAASAQVALPNLQFKSSAQAQLVMMSYKDVVVMLEDSGYDILSIETTMLRRKKITATNGDGIREVVVTRSTGEVLYDVLIDENGIVTQSKRDSLFDGNGKFIPRTSSHDKSGNETAGTPGMTGTSYGDLDEADTAEPSEKTLKDLEKDAAKKAKKSEAAAQKAEKKVEKTAKEAAKQNEKSEKEAAKKAKKNKDSNKSDDQDDDNNDD